MKKAPLIQSDKSIKANRQRTPTNRDGIESGFQLKLICYVTLFLILPIYGLYRNTSRSESSMLMSEIYDLGRITDKLEGGSKMHRSGYDPKCTQPSLLEPVRHKILWSDLKDDYSSNEFKESAAENLGGAIRIRTETFDNVGSVEVDPHWDKFIPFHEYLLKTFPLTHQTLLKTIVQKAALVYHWQGTKPDLKPILLVAHQDVVPIAPGTEEEWEQPPWSGLYDGEWIWGRGSCDDKAGLVSILISIESLLEQGFVPARTVVLAFGADEERGGKETGTALGRYLLQRYGKNSFSIILDEGGKYESSSGGATLSMPAIAEKGKIDMRVEVLSSGGHSSVPPRHTAIGMLASAIVSIEDNPFPVKLIKGSVYHQQLVCEALYESGMDGRLKELVMESMKDGGDGEEALGKIERYFVRSNRFKAQVGTTIAVDLIGGGVKSNALPDEAWSIVNHRISDRSSVSEVQNHWKDNLHHIAKKYNLSFDPFGLNISPTSPPNLATTATKHVLRLSDAYGTALEPSPISPTFGDPVWEIFAGTIRSSITSSPRRLSRSSTILTQNGHRNVIGREGKGIPIIVAPSLGLGNTDTRHYWDLTKNIYRYGHRAKEDVYYRIHTINEAIRAEGFIDMIRFHTQLILNFDEADV